MKEIWAKIENYENLYEISSLGNVRSKSKQLKPFPNGKGYLYVNLCSNGKRKTIAIHRIVAKAFILNLNSKPQVNHKDGIKTNNVFNNLEWVTNAENTQHAYNNHLKKSFGISVIQYNIDNSEINRFNSILNASKITNICHMCIRKCCLNTRKTAGGYIWKFA